MLIKWDMTDPGVRTVDLSQKRLRMKNIWGIGWLLAPLAALLSVYCSENT